MKNPYLAVVFGSLIGLALAAGPATGQTPATEAMRARETLGWRVVVAAPIDRITASGPMNVEVNVKDLDYRVSDAQTAAAVRKLRSAGVTALVYKAGSIPADQSVFEFARKLGVETIVTEPPEGAEWNLIEQLADRYGVNVAIRGGDPKNLLASCERRSKRVGVCGDLELWVRLGIQPVEAVRLLQDRLLVVRVGDADMAGLEELIREVYRSDLKPLWVFENDFARGSAFFDKVIIPIATYHREFGSRTAGIHRLAGPTEEEHKLIEKAIPVSAPAVPRKRRRLLVVDLSVGKLGHPSIPYANIAVDLMGKKTGAYEATFSSDASLLAPDRISQFDAVYLNNAAGNIFDTPALQEGFRRFIAEGGGLIANHAVTVVSPEWAEFGEILGGRGASHRMTDEKVMIKVDDPASPLNAVFGGKEFEYTDEIFRFQPPYSRDKVHVLLSVDVAKTDMNQGRCYGNCVREDGDYPISWIHSYGKGRVYYTCLGHNPHTFWDPRILRQFLAAIQYAMGDLEAQSVSGAAGK